MVSRMIGSGEAPYIQNPVNATLLRLRRRATDRSGGGLSWYEGNELQLIAVSMRQLDLCRR